MCSFRIIIGIFITLFQSGNLQLDFENINLNQLINIVKDTIPHVLKEKNASLVIEEQLPFVKADEARLSEVFINLITNGLKYNEQEQPIIKIGVAPEHSTADLTCIYVKDNGIGIAEQKKNTIFQIFRRLHKKEEYGGGQELV